MDELYRIGQGLGENTPDLPGGMGGMAAGGGAGDPLAELLAGGGDIESYLQQYEQMLAEGMPTEGGPKLNEVDAEGGMLVRPDVGFVVKTTDLQNGTKVFLNITSNENIEAPHLQSLTEVEGDEEGVRVPLSLGSPVEDFDKKNEPCITYDLVANPETVLECGKTPAFRETVVNLCLAAVSNKYKLQLDQRYKLPKMKYKGNVVQLQRIRKKHNSKIQEVGSAPLPGEQRDRSQNGMADSSTLKPPEFCVFYSLADAGLFDGFGADWGPLIEDQHNLATVPHISALDLPVYRVNAWKEAFRGNMKNAAQKETEQVDEVSGAADVQTRELLSGRTCVAQLRMPDLDRHVATLKQFRVEVSDECLRISFPPLPKSTKCAYAPLTLWWPLPFYSAQAVADWNPETDTLQISLPADMPANAALESFDQVLLEAVF